MSKSLTINDVCNITTGKLDSNESNNDGKYPFFTCSEYPSKINEFAYDDDVVLVAGNNARGNFHVSRYKGKFNAYQRTYILTAKTDLSMDFIYYLLKLTMKLLKDKSQGSQTKFLTIGILKNIKVSNLKNANIIAKVLSDLDAKIELNNRINKELEAMAKTLYDYWFVQFDFPDENGKPYKSSGGKMVYNAELKREIPEGWEVGTIDNIAKLYRGVSYGKNDIKQPNDVGTIPILRTTNITGNVIDLDNMVYVPNKFVSSQQLLNKFDILITMSSGSKEHIGKNGFYYFDKKVAFGAFCAKLVAKKNFQYYLYSYTQSDFMFATIKNECLGTNINNLNSSLVNGFKVILPHFELIEIFNNQVENIYDKIANNQKQNQQLTALRDWLLPMLMNGQVSVK